MSNPHHFVVRLSPREYAAVLRLVVANDVAGHAGVYMDQEIKRALAGAQMQSGEVQGGEPTQGETDRDASSISSIMDV